MNTSLLDEIKLAYQTPNLRPIRRLYCLHDAGVDFVCPLVALAIQNGQVDRADLIDDGAYDALVWAAGQWGLNFVIGLLDGFDGQNKVNDDLDYVDGHDLGMAAALQLSPRDL